MLEAATLTWLEQGGHNLAHTTSVIWSLAWNGLSRLSADGQAPTAHLGIDSHRPLEAGAFR
jgi:hypothetical protein